MQIVVNHLTRMSGDRICLAGVDPETKRHVRPVAVKGFPITRTLLRDSGIPARVRVLVEVVDPQSCPEVPHTEDIRVNHMRFIREVPLDEYLDVLESVRVRRLGDAFGEDLKSGSSGHITLEPRLGTGSLGVVRKNAKDLRVHINHYEEKGSESARLELDLAGKWADLAITDSRLYELDGSVNRSNVARLSSALRTSRSAYVMLGLGRIWARDGQAPCHWLQVNGLAIRA